MTKIELEIHDDVISTLNKIKNINDEGVELEIPEGSVLFESSLNLMLLNKEAEEMGKTLHFQTFDEAGINLIESITETGGRSSSEENYPEKSVTEQEVIPVKKSIGILNVLKSIKKPNFSNFKLKTPIVVVIISLVIIGIIYFLAYSAPKADIKIIISPQPLTKSVSIKAKKDVQSNADTKILRGIAVSAETSQTQSIDTTGTKLVGTKAEGEVTIYNFTSTEETLKKGTTLTYDGLKFSLDNDVTVPAQTVDPITLTPARGEVAASITAEIIGKEHNISKSKTLSVKGFKTAELAASSTETFKGGESEQVKIVDAKDLTTLSSTTLTLNQEASQTSLASKVGTGQKLINGSSKSTITSEVFDAKVGEEKSKLSLTQTVTNTGLAYSSDDLNKILDSLGKGFVPEGFVLSTKNREVNVEVLGNSDTTVLSPVEADLQVTLKTFVVPDIQIDKVKESLLGKSLSDAQMILGKIRNIKTYSININPKIPLLNRVPQNAKNVNIEVVTNE